MNKILIKLEDIRKAEEILIFPNIFDDERISFIQNLRTCDLMAVPGSGKTTALLAKLFCLAQHLPLSDGSGILVLSHTNAAIDEIKNRLYPHCPQLFEYPNFIGTIQSFVNHFLANKANIQKYQCNIQLNDNDRYKWEAIKFYHSLDFSKKGVEPKNLKNKLIIRANPKKNSLSFQQKQLNAIDLIFSLTLDLINRKVLLNDKTWLKYNGSAPQDYLTIENWKESLFKQGILSFKDSYLLSEWYLAKYPSIKKILQKRFKYIFIDETQDLEESQIELIDCIFFNDDSNNTIQRIGDPNQSIYNSVKQQCDWAPRENNCLYLNGSYRLTSINAELINFFNTYGDGGFHLIGKRNIDDNLIPPYLILFDENTKDELKSNFIKLIKKYKLNELDESKYGFKILGWTGEPEDSKKWCLHSIFGYKKSIKTKKNSHNTLSLYIQLFDRKDLTLKSIKNNILESLLTVLRLDNKKIEKNIKGKVVYCYFTKKDMLEHIQNLSTDHDYYEKFNQNLFNWCFFLITRGNYREIYTDIVQFINKDLKEWFKLTLKANNYELQLFLGSDYEPLPNNNNELLTTVEDEIKVEVTTVHSAKGQTHCATLYVETEYHKTESMKLLKKKDNQILPSPLLKQKHKFNGQREKETLKMMYVGLSRPTHLLCLALLKENVQEFIPNLKDAGWQLIDLTNDI